MTDKEKFLSFLKNKIGKPYELGAIGPDRFDCSGLIFSAIKNTSVSASVPRLSTEQYELGEEIEFSEIDEGDLIFFDTGWTERVPNHNGVCLSAHMMINANSYYNAVLEEPFSTGYWSDKIYEKPRRIFDSAGKLKLTKTPGTSPETPEPSPFSDVSHAHEFFEHIKKLATNRVIKGFPDGTFKPEFDINRAECLKIILLAMNIDIPETHSPCGFTDLGDEKWYDKYIAQALSKNIINGYPDGTFKPNKSINRAEICKIIFLAGNQTPSTPLSSAFTDIGLSDWFAPYALKAIEWNMITPISLNKFAPTQKIKRGEMCKAIVNFIKKI